MNAQCHFEVAVYPELGAVVVTDDYAEALTFYKTWCGWITEDARDGCFVVLWDNDNIIPPLTYSYADNGKQHEYIYPA